MYRIEKGDVAVQVDTDREFCMALQLFGGHPLSQETVENVEHRERRRETF